MEIAVLIGEIAYVSRRQFLQGIVSAAQKDGSNAVLFTCEGFLFHEFKNYSYGEYNIFKLPAIEKYDGVIVDFNSIQNPKIVEELKDSIIQTEIPCVSVGIPIDGAGLVSFDNTGGLEKVIEHLIKDHKLKDIHFIAGPECNTDSIEREKTFINVMKSHDLKAGKSQIHHGNFSYASGRAIIHDEYSNGKKLPQAFVAANDFMALGVMEELQSMGIRVPEDVIVTGYDNDSLAACSTPPLTTVDRQEKLAGSTCFELLKKKVNKVSKEKNIVIQGKPIISCSCGCKNHHAKSDSNPLGVEQMLRLDSSLDLIKGMTIELSNIATITDVEICLERYIKYIGMDFFYYCQCGTRESYYEELEAIASGERVRRNMTAIQDVVWCPLAYEDGSWNTYPSFNRTQLFPTASKYKKEASYYIVMPVHQGKICLGYAIMGNFKDILSGRVMQHLVLIIEGALGNVRNQDIMNTMLARVNQKWQYDELTGLYNRSGMNNNVQRLFNMVDANSGGIGVLFFDLDGLKVVNDTLGHEAGDEYIKAMADMLSEAADEDDLVIRYGGDEFIIITVQDSWDATIKKLEYVQSMIIEPVSASAGCVFGEETGMEELKLLIEEADRKMYEYKKRKKIART